MNNIMNNYFSCPICLKDNILENNIYTTNCNHIFCKSCIEKWFNKGKKTCPMCIQNIISYKYNNEYYKLVFKEVHIGQHIYNTDRDINRDINRDNIENVFPNHMLISKLSLKITNYTMLGLFCLSSLFFGALLSIIHERNDLQDELELYTNDLVDVRVYQFTSPLYCRVSKYIIDNCQ